MKIEYINGNIVLYDVNDFDPHPDGGFIGTAMGRTVRITQAERTVILHNTSLDDFNNVWYDFLDLGRDYGAIKKALTKDNDHYMTMAVDYGQGIRILKQALWETIISFIISASNNIPRIKKIINTLCSKFGSPHTYQGNTYYSFPSPEVIAGLTPDEFSIIRAGFREKYILACAKAVVSGDFNLDELYNMSTPDAKKALMSLSGIGNKVSDCILLFSLNRFDSFPVDVWIKRIMEFCYFNNTTQSIDTISALAREKYGELGGIAQQYLFYYARELKIGT